MIPENIISEYPNGIFTKHSNPDGIIVKENGTTYILDLKGEVQFEIL